MTLFLHVYVYTGDVILEIQHNKHKDDYREVSK